MNLFVFILLGFFSVQNKERLVPVFRRLIFNALRGYGLLFIMLKYGNQGVNTTS
jgi:hypothetical protein